MPHPKVTLKIPKPLYDHISRLIEGSGFNSVTDFVVFVLRDIVYEGRVPAAGSALPEPAAPSAGRGAGAGGGGKGAPDAGGRSLAEELPEFSGEQLERIKEKLKSLGYL
jgi:hypothetical protein